jgi:hypothetical protein
VVYYKLTTLNNNLSKNLLLSSQKKQKEKKRIILPKSVLCIPSDHQEVLALRVLREITPRNYDK